MSFIEITTEQLTNAVKQEFHRKTAGRPSAKQADALAMDSILLSKEKREALVFQIKRLAKDIELQKQRAEGLREDIKASAENLGLSVAKFKSLISDYDSGNLTDIIQEKTSYVDVLEVVKELTQVSELTDKSDAELTQTKENTSEDEDYE